MDNKITRRSDNDEIVQMDVTDMLYLISQSISLVDAIIYERIRKEVLSKEQQEVYDKNLSIIEDILDVIYNALVSDKLKTDNKLILILSIQNAMTIIKMSLDKMSYKHSLNKQENKIFKLCYSILLETTKLVMKEVNYIKQDMREILKNKNIKSFDEIIKSHDSVETIIKELLDILKITEATCNLSQDGKSDEVILTIKLKNNIKGMLW